VRSMRVLKLIIPAFAAAAFTATALAVAPIAKPTPAGTLKAENAAYNVKDFAALYSAYTARYKAACPYAKFLKTIREARAATGPITLRITGVLLDGAKASLAYQIIVGGKVLDAVTSRNPDLFVRRNGLWYDEVDGKTGCE
jgi:hypothetical protein